MVKSCEASTAAASSVGLDLVNISAGDEVLNWGEVSDACAAA